MNDAAPKRLRLRTLFLMATVAVILLAGLFAFPLLTDAARFKAPLERALRDATGWEVSLGEIDYSILGGMVLRVAPASLEEPAGDSRIDIERIEISATPWSLLRAELAIEQISVVRPKIRLVRERATDPWPVPLPAKPVEADVASDEGDGRNGLKVRIGKIDVRDGLVSAEDRSVTPPVRMGVQELDLSYDLVGGELSSSAALTEHSGRFRGTGNLEDGLIFELDGVATEALHPFLGPELILGGGLVGGTLEFKPPFEIVAELDAEQLALLVGEEPLAGAQVRFRLAEGADDILELDGLELTSGQARLHGGGPISPAMDLNLEFDEAPLEDTLRAARSVFPFPLEFESPGTGRAQIHLFSNPGEEVQFEATGRLTAAGFELAEYLPKAAELGANFAVTPDGKLTVELDKGQIAGGPLRGVARLDSIDPVGTLRFDGGLEGSPLGALLAGFLGEEGGSIEGPSGLTAAMRVDLSNPEIDFSALGGNLQLESTDVTLPGWDLESRVAERLDEELEKLGALGEFLKKRTDSKREELLDEARKGSVAAEKLLSRLDVDVDFNQQPWQLRRIAFAGDRFVAEGLGAFDPASGKVDLRLEAVFDEERTQRWVDDYSLLKGLVKEGRLHVPVLIEGPMTAPAVGVNLDGLADGKKEETKDRLKGLLNKILDKN